MIEIINKPWNYKFIERNTQYFLFVMCGGVAVFEINIQLNDEETLLYKNLGTEYIDQLAKKIQYSPSLYSSRNLPEGYFDIDLL
ncbi:hypothetical protein [Flectobacillus longus]|uniref:Uncharacterized protein n=1 Tax=Flectobacillus longus TaxID=2984207 RepID=A0ABT6YTA7_9BACT|nr:hypothetical protein [Flectobacillus longus]MDI9866837.1 hypothetical protein [Flectobacillus longus]MDI9881030.1 hypothetical protein [Flectobacillus longus]